MVRKRVPTTLLSKALTTTPGDSTYANPDVDHRTEVTNIILTAQSANVAKRTVTLYKGGTSLGNEKYSVDVQYTEETAPRVVMIGYPLILTGTDAIFVKLDDGSDVNIEVIGIVEDLI